MALSDLSLFPELSCLDEESDCKYLENVPQVLIFLVSRIAPIPPDCFCSKNKKSQRKLISCRKHFKNLIKNNSDLPKMC